MMKTERVKQSVNQEGPQHAEDSGPNSPSVWGKGGKEFKVGQASEGSTAVKTPESVNLETGEYHCRY